MIIVTGGAGFIGSNLVTQLNQRGHDNILIVDDLTHGKKFTNLLDCRYADFLDKRTFITKIEKAESIFPEPIEAVFHQGACSTTTEWDGRYMMENNYQYSKVLMHFCVDRAIPYIYASSAAVYGIGNRFSENIANEKPLNVYGYSKFQFDQYVRNHLPDISSQVVGLRYFNIYGPHEAHKGNMASMAFHLNNQLTDVGKLCLFEGTDGYGDGEQRRDFVYVGDAVAINLWFFDHPEISGIYNVGTGKSQPFNDVAKAVIDYHGGGAIEYIPFPDHLKGCYQCFTQADLAALRNVGCQHEFNSVEEGVPVYMEWLNR